MKKQRGFEVVSKYEGKGINLPVRGTKFSAGYDMESAEEVVIPSIWSRTRKLTSNPSNLRSTLEYLKVNGLEKTIKSRGLRPTLVSTGLKAYMLDGEYLKLVSRSSTPLKKGLIVSNGIGIIDAKGR